MSKILSERSWLTCYNLLAFIFITTSLSNVASATTPKPTNGTRYGYPLAEIASSTKKSANNQTEYHGSSDLLESAASVSSKSFANKAEDQDAAPSVTSVHQVWTSSSSGSLDELSPEVISKLRQDVPFLAAYALRPRLVGASGSSQQFAGHPQMLSSSPEDRAKTQLGLLTAASSPRVSQSGVLGPRLGDISEYQVETSSTSKSEHHHKRKTTLKKKTDEELEAKRRQVLAASQLVARRPSAIKASKPSRINKSGKKQSRGRSSRSRGGKRNRLRRKKNSRTKAGRLRRKSAAGGTQARYYQEGSSIGPGNEIDGDTGKGRMELESQPMSMQTTTPSGGETKGANERGRDSSGVKGGSSVDRSNQKPFYARSKPSDNPEEVGEDQKVSGGAGGAEGSDRSASDVNDTGSDNNNNDSDNNNGNVADDTVDSDNSEDGVEAGVSEPRRVGDDDVEEDGDTVTVMPKSDGVDDDPDIGDAPLPPTDRPEEEAEVDSRDPERENEAGSGSDNDLNDEGGKVDKERPNLSPTDTDDGQSEGRASGDGSAAGGGVGATTGGASAGRDSGSASTDGDSSGRGGEAAGGDSGVSSSEDDDPSTAGEGKPSRGNDRDSDNDPIEGSTRDKSGDRADKRPGSRSEESDGDGDAQRGAEEFEPERSGGRKQEDSDGWRRPASGSSPTDKTDGRAGDEDSAGDVDYRDEMAEAERKQREKTGDDKVAGGKAKKGDRKECDDGSYDHHSDHHDHHDHHNSIEWLRGAIPGEPGIDYPTLSGINKSDFNCREQKYPGYYADVDSRCQIFHICQADGRQDSFICPNGTIFSQISTVCVWWNSFDCEDAPKYYALNALLYKTPTSSTNNNSPSDSELKPRDGARLEPKDRGVERGRSNSEESSIDDLIRAMRRSKEASETEDRQAGVTYDSPKKAGSMRGGFGADDEATIQRKSTNLDDESELTSSRLRSEAVPRRKRRASVKQAPPKLKSRRVSRNSRRRKLRHGIKPKRRA